MPTAVRVSTLWRLGAQPVQVGQLNSGWSSIVENLNSAKTTKAFELKKLSNLYFICDTESEVEIVAKGLGLSHKIPFYVLIISTEAEMEFERVELEYKKRKPEEIESTKFRVTLPEKKLVIVVESQKPR